MPWFDGSVLLCKSSDCAQSSAHVRHRWWSVALSIFNMSSCACFLDVFQCYVQNMHRIMNETAMMICLISFFNLENYHDNNTAMRASVAATAAAATTKILVFKQSRLLPWEQYLFIGLALFAYIHFFFICSGRSLVKLMWDTNAHRHTHSRARTKMMSVLRNVALILMIDSPNGNCNFDSFVK